MTAAISLEGYINGSATYDVAATLALANETDAYGLSGGTIIVDSVNESIAQGDFKKISVSATQYASTMTA
jgi:hypothetical protein